MAKDKTPTIKIDNPSSSSENNEYIPRPDDHDSRLEDWTELPPRHISPSKPTSSKRKRIFYEESEEEEEEEASDESEGSLYEHPEGGRRGNISSSDNESIVATKDVDVASEEDSDPADIFSSPESSPNPYSPPPLKKYALDLDWNEYTKVPFKRNKERLRKEAGKLSCVGQHSLAKNDEVRRVMKYYAHEGKYVRPPPHLRPHRFDIGNIWIPRDVLTVMHIPYGVGAPLHPWLRQLCNWFKIEPIQLSPNSFRSSIGLYIMYMDEKFPEPSMRELCYFFSIQKSGIGYFHLVAWRVHMSKGFNEGRISHIKGWKEKFIYVFDTER